MWSRLMSTPLNLEYAIDRPQDALIFKDSLLVSFPASRVDFTYNHGDEFDLGKVKLRAIHAPGHCRGHCCFYWEKEGILFTSDIDFNQGGPWYFNESADIDEFITSIRQVILINPRIIVPGHGRLVESPIEKAARDYLDHIYRREKRILAMLDQPRSLEEMTGQNLIYSEYIRPTLLFWERVMIFKHLNRLLKLGEVNQKDDFYYRV